MKNKRFEEYFLKYKNLVIRIVMNKTGDYQTAQEICQQVFISFYTNMDKVSPELVKAWLIRSNTKCRLLIISERVRQKEKHIVETTCSDNGNVLVEESVEIYTERQSCREFAGRILREVRAVNEQWFEVLMMHCVGRIVLCRNSQTAEYFGICVKSQDVSSQSLRQGKIWAGISGALTGKIRVGRILRRDWIFWVSVSIMILCYRKVRAFL